METLYALLRMQVWTGEANHLGTVPSKTRIWPKPECLNNYLETYPEPHQTLQHESVTDTSVL